MSKTITQEFLLQIPKTDLHVHLDGSLRISTLIELAKADGVELRRVERREVLVGQSVGLDDRPQEEVEPGPGGTHYDAFARQVGDGLDAAALGRDE